MNKVLVNLVNYEKYCRDGCDHLVANGFDLRFNPFGRIYQPEELHEAVSDAVAVVADNELWDEAAFAAAKNLKVIAKFGVGLNNFDLDAARRHGVIVANCAGLNANTVSEQTLALFFAVTRSIPRLAATVREGRWETPLFREYSGKIAGVLGFGAIGRKVAEKLVALGLRVLAYDKFPNHAEVGRIGVNLGGMEEIMAASDYLFLHVPYLPETHHLINDETLALMKPGAFLINTARGMVVDEAAVARALESGRLAGMASDVFEVEPPPPDMPLFRQRNYVCTPHIAGDAYENMQANGLATATIITDVFAGREPKNRQA